MVGLEHWPVVATGVVILIAIAASNRALPGEMSELRRDLGGRIDRLGELVDGLSERVTEVRVRLARVEGLLEGIRFKSQQSDGKGRGGEEL